MIKLYNGSFSSSSFHRVTILCSIAELIEIIGEPQHYANDGSDKVNVEWDCITDDGIIFSIYDWKYFREVDEDEDIEFHIGGRSFIETFNAQVKLLRMIEEHRTPESKAFNELKDIYNNED